MRIKYIDITKYILNITYTTKYKIRNEVSAGGGGHSNYPPIEYSITYHYTIHSKTQKKLILYTLAYKAMHYIKCIYTYK